VQNITLDETAGVLKVNYIDGTSEAIVNNFYIIDTFYYDPVESKLYIKKSTETEAQVFPLAYPTHIRYNAKDDVIEYKRAG